MPEFTGERVVPGFVDADLYNEHFARYAFAARLAGGRRVLDAGCGSGYGSAELARIAGAVTAIDFSEEAISFARHNFQAENLRYEVGDCLSLPQGPFDLIVAFEVIEHLADWRGFLGEAKRALAPGGLFLVSTPNKLYYAESRGQSGENLFHVHEFEYAEFDAELKSVFQHVGMFVQNHVEGIAFTPLEVGYRADAAIGENSEAPEIAHFYLAVCGLDPLPPASAFVFVPGTGNILRERERHIDLLTGEVALKKVELDERNREYGGLLQMFRDLNAQMEERNRWAIQARAEADQRGARIVELQEELAREQMNFGQIAAGYEAKVSELEEVNRAKTEWAIETERRLMQEIHERSEELGRCVELLDRAEQTVIERTHWAQDLQRELSDLQTRLANLQGTNWVKLGSKLNLVSKQQ